jgi:hypothetical protein
MKLLIAEEDLCFRKPVAKVLPTEHAVVVGEDGNAAWAGDQALAQGKPLQQSLPGVLRPERAPVSREDGHGIEAYSFEPQVSDCQDRRLPVERLQVGAMLGPWKKLHE